MEPAGRIRLIDKPIRYTIR